MSLQLELYSRSCQRLAGYGRGQLVTALGMVRNIVLRMQDYRKLKVWKKGHTVAMDILRATKSFGRDARVLRGQLQRAALSIPTNIAEGSGKMSDPEFARFLEIALGSASETLYHLAVAREIGELEAAAFDDLSDRVTEVRRMLFGLIKRIRTDITRQQQTSSTN